MIFAVLSLMLGVTLASTAPLDLLRAAVDPNPTLRSYTATARLTALVHAAIPVRRSFSGTAYYIKPKEKIVFDGVPAPLSRFRALDTTTPTFADATADYVIAPLANDGRFSTYELDPKKPGSRVKSLVLTVDDEAALVTSAVWKYVNGGSLSFKQQYETIGSYRLPSSIAIAARFPDYAVDGTIQLSDYHTNVDVPVAVFSTPP